MNKASGFTIIELMVIMAILAITLAFGVPQINNVVLDNRRVDALNMLSANLAYARSEAIRRTLPVGLTTVAGDWHLGWTVYIDTNGNEVMDAPGEAPIRVEDSLNLPPTTTITCIPPPPCPGGDIVFSPDGSVNATTTLTLIDTMVPGNAVDRDLDISPTGRVSFKDYEP